ncbi:DUF6069 family protein [Actinomadura napierensis]|uniref:Uncharacterized protein n=1 Tax=Actinomadura napierensis TaxID=267854 RepID=A0ABN2YDM4_9ACTN
MKSKPTSRRLITTGAAVAAAVAVWAAAKGVGTSLKQPAGGSGTPADLPVGAVVFVSAATALLGWSVLALLERFTPRPGRIWTAVATACLLLSLSGLFTGHGVSTVNRLGLVLLHLTAGAVVIPALALTARRAS